MNYTKNEQSEFLFGIDIPPYKNEGKGELEIFSSFGYTDIDLIFRHNTTTIEIIWDNFLMKIAAYGTHEYILLLHFSCQKIYLNE